MAYRASEALTYASHGPDSAARRGDLYLRGSLRPMQPVNEFLHCMRDGWDRLTAAQRAERVRQDLLFIADPVTHLEWNDPLAFADLTLGELHHARAVLLRLLPHLVAAARAEQS